MNYSDTHLEAVLRFHASDMQLHIETDAAYLVLPNACSRAAAYFYMGDQCSFPPTKSELNGAIHVLCKSIPNIVSSALEPNPVPFTWLLKKLFQLSKLWKKWVILNIHLVSLLPLIISQLMVFLIIPCKQNYPRLRTCATTGWKTASSKIFLNCFGTMESAIWQTISPKLLRQVIIASWGESIFKLFNTQLHRWRGCVKPTKPDAALTLQQRPDGLSKFDSNRSGTEHGLNQYSRCHPFAAHSSQTGPSESRWVPKLKNPNQI